MADMKKQKKPVKIQKPESWARTKRLIYYILVLILSVAILQIEFVFIVGSKNGEYFVGRYKLLEDDFYHPRLVLLRKREKLDEVTANGKTQFEKIVLLRKWVSGQWKGGSNFYYPPWDAVEILNLSRNIGNRAFCAQFAIVFLQACQSMGIHARYVDLPGHFVVAVWSDDYNRWIIMDPSEDVHYEKNGIPMRGRDLCDSYWRNSTGNLYKVNSDGIKTKLKKEDIGIYRMYSIVLKANQLSDPVEVEINMKRQKLVLQSDYKSYPYVGRDSIGFGTEFLAWKEDDATEYFDGKRHSDDPDDFRDVRNQTMIYFAKNKNNFTKIKLHAENAPYFAGYLVSINNSPWQIAEKDIVLWTLKPGMNQISAKIKTRFGWEGKESYLKIFFKPRLIRFPFFRGAKTI